MPTGVLQGRCKGRHASPGHGRSVEVALLRGYHFAYPLLIAELRNACAWPETVWKDHREHASSHALRVLYTAYEEQ
jgi:hypothetical protein